MSKRVSLPDGYHIVWSEDFNSNTINEAVWSAETRAPGWVNGERQEYCGDKCIEVRESCLCIRPKITTSSSGEMRYLSGRLTSLGKKDITYGKISVRIKVPKAKGILSYIRLMPTDGYDFDAGDYKEFPLHGQIDMVNISGDRTDEVSSGIVFGYPYTERSGSYHRLNTDFSSEFHVFSCEWDQDEIVFSCDGKIYYRTSYWFARTGETEEPYPAPFNKPFHFVIGVSVGSDRMGKSSEVTTDLKDNDAELLVDYIRLYQKPVYDRHVVRPARVLTLNTEDKDSGNRIQNGVNNAFYVAEGDLNANVSFMEDELIITPSFVAGSAGETRLLQSGFPFRKGEVYEFSFDGRADEDRSIRCLFEAGGEDYKEQLVEPYTVSLDRHWQKHRMLFEVDEDCDNASIVFAITAISKASIHIRNISLKKRVGKDNLRKLIAVCGVWDDADNYSLFLRSLQTEELNKDYVVASFTFNVDSPDPLQTDLELKFTDILLNMDLAAVVIFGEMIKTREVIERLAAIGHEKGIPVITFQYPIKGCINADFEYASAFRAIVEHVIDVHGARRLDMMAGFRDNAFSEERIRVFKEVLESRGIDPGSANIYYGDFWQAPAYTIMDNLLESGYELPDAVICANDSMAMAVCDALGKWNISVPEDVIVTGFDGIWQGQFNDPVLTTCELDYKQISEKILRTINNWNKGDRPKQSSFHIPYRSMFMQSCGCKKSSEFQWSEIVDELAEESQESFRHMLEMGRFVSHMTSSDNLDDAAENLQNSIWMWRSEYYFVCVEEKDECCHSVFHGRANKYTYAQKFYRMKYPIPDYDLILSPDSDINVLLFRQIRSGKEAFGYVVNGYSNITLRSEQRFEEFSHFVNAAVNAVSNNRKLITKNKKSEMLSELDFLTGLYNRRGFFTVIKKLINTPANFGRILSLFSVDMDRLKTINDTYGHDNGDIAIQTLARAIQKYVRDQGVAARYGGDEFALAVISDRRHEDEVRDIRSEIEQYADQDPAMTDKAFEVGASIGISERVIDSSIDIDDMIMEADSKMYADKMSRKRLRGV